ncbi:hypothetical protein D7004_02050 [Pedobacter jejuensis]|uniref:Uncharacterized protein n=1 Tax=Pedobacter jejuensis TaxID=1268550 RepID=A0A3N0C2G6_9SPHI|nr:hypothetical protein D7004_02050 [Pedobacter jejuensis]
MQPFEKDKPENHSFDLARIYLHTRFVVLNWIATRYLLIELSKQLTLWPYQPLFHFIGCIFKHSKK